MPTETRQDDRPQAKMASKPTALRDWERRLFNEDVDDRPSKPSWSPFMSIEESTKFEKKSKKMRQMRDIGDVGDVQPLKSYEEQVLGITQMMTPRDAGKAKPSQGDQGVPPTIAEDEEDTDLVGLGKAIEGHQCNLTPAFWTVWPPRVTVLAASSKGLTSLRPDPGSQGLSLYNQERRDHSSVEFAAELNLTRGLDSPGCAGICFQCRPKGAGMRGYVFYVEYDAESDEDTGRLLLGRFHAHATKNDMPELVKVVAKEVSVGDGWHPFRVRCISGNLMLFYDYEFVDYVEADTKAHDDHPKRGFCGIWSHDMEVPMKNVVIRSLEDLGGKAPISAVQADEQKSKEQEAHDAQILAKKRLDAAVLIQWLVRRKLKQRHERMKPYLDFSDDPEVMSQVRRRTLAVWISTFYTMRKLQQKLDDDDIKEKRMQKYLEAMDRVEPPPPPPPLEPPPSAQDEELHYLYELQQQKYKRQIEQSSRKVLSKAKLETLRNMTQNSLASQQKKLVADKQRKMADEASSEQEHKALKQMAKRLTSNFEEMTNMVSTLRGYTQARQRAADETTSL